MTSNSKALFSDVNKLRSICHDYSLYDVLDSIEYDYGFDALEKSKSDNYWMTVDASAMYNAFVVLVDKALASNDLSLMRRGEKWTVIEK